uniref:Peroxidase n=1 Tax=Colocasia esculenta TaxID=4460 RepID=A0A060A1M7_COLES|nr:peroxidase [Colocasia esculenta]
MGSSSKAAFLLPLAIMLVFMGGSFAQLSTNFYSSSCPNLFSSVWPGCDGSLLLDDTSSFTGEKNAVPNRNSARGFEVIDRIKAQLGGPHWNVKLGRRDARTASQSAANNNIPPPTSSLSSLISRFQSKGLSAKDLVALSGSHTIGQARCTSFRAHIYNESNIDGSFAQTRQSGCPRASGSGDNNLAPLDLQTPTFFDNGYFQNLVSRRGLLHSDQELFNGGSTDSQVRAYVNSPGDFHADFVAAMIKMGDISPLTAGPAVRSGGTAEGSTNEDAQHQSCVRTTDKFIS